MAPQVRLVLAALWLAAPLAAAQPQAKLPTLALSAGIHVIQAEVANTLPSRAQGLMFRKSLAANQGMLFVFPDIGPQCMWMRNTYVPLSVAFIDEAGVILNIADMKPQTEDSHCAAKPARYALEMNQGWFAAKGIKPGARITGIEKAPAPR
ncbi:MAG TPA: DUF192 domain-containing protein [Burkholderiales bacterium]|nr:DUF192 domain-containing protein [Burkholderiales bacterium]